MAMPTVRRLKDKLELRTICSVTRLLRGARGRAQWGLGRMGIDRTFAFRAGSHGDVGVITQIFI
jgi:hypothetical protein